MTACDAPEAGHGERPGTRGTRPPDGGTPPRNGGPRDGGPRPRDGVRNAVVMVIGGPVAPGDVPGLCRRARESLAGDADVLVCDVGGLTEPDMGTVDALARLQLTATRLGHRFLLRNVGEDLSALLEVTGLDCLLRPTGEAGPAGPDEDAGAG